MCGCLPLYARKTMMNFTKSPLSVSSLARKHLSSGKFLCKHFCVLHKNMLQEPDASNSLFNFVLLLLCVVCVCLRMREIWRYYNIIFNLPITSDPFIKFLLSYKSANNMKIIFTAIITIPICYLKLYKKNIFKLLKM